MNRSCRRCGNRWEEGEDCPRCGSAGVYQLRDEQLGLGFEVEEVAIPEPEEKAKRERKGTEQTAMEVEAEKPPYRIPLMSEIARVPENGLTLVSTFSGCGGSCLGFRMAGFEALAASEFVPAAVDTYRANFPTTPVIVDDVRSVEPAMIMERYGLRQGELDVLEGSPPCASFSSAGKREAGWGQEKKYSDVVQRTDDLFDEYVRLVAGFRPRVFVAENVAGFLHGAADHFRAWVEGMLSDLGYLVWHEVLDASFFGVPQRRRRVIIVGVRKDLGIHPSELYPKPATWSYSIRDAIGMPEGTMVGTRIGGEDALVSAERPSPTITANGIGGRSNRGEKDSQMLHLPGIPEGTTLEGPPSRERYGKPRTMDLDEPMDTLRTPSGGDNTHYVFHPPTEEERKAVSIERYAIGEAWDEIGGLGQSERYFSLVRPDPDEPLPTVTQTGGQMGAAGVVHPTEKRKFTIPELRRLCGFPDDFVLTGSYTQQWERLGRAVPPPMMEAVARTIRDRLLELG